MSDIEDTETTLNTIDTSGEIEEIETTNKDTSGEIEDDSIAEKQDEKEEDGEKEENEEIVEKEDKDEPEPAEKEENGPEDDDDNDLRRDIFGSSDESDDEFEGFGGEGAEKEEKEKKAVIEDDDDDEVNSHKPGPSSSKKRDDSEIESEDEDRRGTGGMVYDFDIMLAKKKAQTKTRRKKNVDIINDNDEVVAVLLENMRKAAEADMLANEKKQAAIHKLKMIDVVASNLMKIDYRETLLDSGVLRVIAGWLSRLPDGSLPCLKIRTTMLNILTYLNTDDIEMIKSSGLGKVIMYMFKNPKETRENKKKAGQLITLWSKNIFNVETEGGANLREERERRDVEMQAVKRRSSSSGIDPVVAAKKAKEDALLQLKPGDKGWVSRARVPIPSMKDYVVRPKSTIDIDLTKVNNKKEMSRFDKHMRAFKEKKKQNKTARAFTISIEGRKMPL